MRYPQTLTLAALVALVGCGPNLQSFQQGFDSLAATSEALTTATATAIDVAAATEEAVALQTAQAHASANRILSQVERTDRATRRALRAAAQKAPTKIVKALPTDLAPVTTEIRRVLTHQKDALGQLDKQLKVYRSETTRRLADVTEKLRLANELIQTVNAGLQGRSPLEEGAPAGIAGIVSLILGFVLRGFYSKKMEELSA
jgi:hypothetical protein